MASHASLARVRARRLTGRAGLATLCAVSIAGLTVAPFAPAKQPETAKTPPGHAKRGTIPAPGAGAPSTPPAPVTAPAPVKPAKPPKAVKVGKPVKAPRPVAADEPANLDKPAKPAHAGPPGHAHGRKKVDTSAPAPTPAPSQAASPAAAPTTPATPSTPATTEAQPTGASSPGGEPSRRTRGGSRGRPGAERDTRRSGGDRAAPAGSIAGPGRDLAARAGAATAASAAGAGTAAAARRAGSRGDGDGAAAEPASPVVRTVRDIVATVPGWMKLALVALGGLSLLLAGGYAASFLRARSLARQRDELLGDVGLLQRALLPSVPDRVGGVAVSVAYRPADGPGAGGDFYDVLPLDGGRTGFVLGDISGHGRTALERTALMRYTLRAYLEAELEPAAALRLADQAIGDGLDGDFATVLLAVHDPRDGSLTYATAGHPPPIVTGGAPFEPVIAGSSPPIGIGQPTGLRQTTVPLVPRGVACFYTDGLTEARTAAGLLGPERLEEIVGDLGPEPSAVDLLERVAGEATATPDDMAACVLTPTATVTSGGFRGERLELSADELDGPLLDRFLAECGVPAADRAAASDEAFRTAQRFGGAIVDVAFSGRRIVDVRPRNVERIELPARRAAV